MQQLAPASGQLVVHQGQLVYETPTKQRVVVEDDRATYLAQLLPLAMTGQLNEQQMQMVRREHDAVLQSVSSQYHQMAMTVVSQQQKTIDGLIGALNNQTDVLNKLAEPVEPQTVVVQETIVRGEDFAGKIIFVLSLVLGLLTVSLATNYVARIFDQAGSRPAHVEYYR